MSSDWIDDAIRSIKAMRIEHRTFNAASNDVFSALWAASPGELVVLVGPSRVGRSRALQDALIRTLHTPNSTLDHPPWVVIQAANESTSGEFSTKSFMQQACAAIKHPIYGVADPDDRFHARLNARLHRTSEHMLRQAFQQALKYFKVQVVAIDESHHVGYVAGGLPSAARVIDSWKCLAFEANVVLVLIGSYKLLPLLQLAPHLIGRQRTIEFPRYRIASKADVEAWEGILEVLSKPLRFPATDVSLRSWNKFLFEKSLGCLGHLLMWLRAALARMKSRGMGALTLQLLQETQFPLGQLRALSEEIVAGERDFSARDSHGASISEPSKSEEHAQTDRAQRAPFQRANKRQPSGGRA